MKVKASICNTQKQATENIDSTIAKLTDFGKVIFGLSKLLTILKDMQKITMDCSVTRTLIQLSTDFLRNKSKQYTT